MDFEENNRLTRKENFEKLKRLFPDGPAGGDVLTELAPDGWQSSELMAIAHPSVEKRFEEALRLHNKIESFISKRSKEPRDPPPTIEEITESHVATPIDVQAECAGIVGCCLWDIFSDNNAVITSDGREMDLGSFRGSGSTLAQWYNELAGERKYDYIDFYMGTSWVRGRADLSPVYRMIFRRLLKFGFSWQYSHPRIGVVRFERPPAGSPGGAGYDPSKALEQEAEEMKKKREFDEMQERLRESSNESVRDAKTLPPPATVRAYMDVFGRAPQDWPQVADEGVGPD